MSQRYAGVRTLAEIDWNTWEAVDQATLTFVIDGDRLLLIWKKRGLGAGKINGPGGKLDPGETPEACAVRECEEEVGITPTALSYMGQNLFQFMDGYSIHVWTYLSRSHSGTAIETDEALPLWVPLDAIPYGEMWVDDELWLPPALAGKTFLGRWIFEGDAYLDYALETFDA